MSHRVLHAASSRVRCSEVRRACCPASSATARGASEDAHGVRVAAAAGHGAPVDVGGPCGAVTRVVRPARDGAPAAACGTRSGSRRADACRLVHDGRHPGLRGEVVVVDEAAAVVDELSEDVRGVDAAERGGIGVEEREGDGESTSAKIAAAPGQKLSRSAQGWQAPRAARRHRGGRGARQG